MTMLTLDTIHQRLARYRPTGMMGDHLLNPGLLPVRPYRPAAVLIALLPRGDDFSVVFTQRSSRLHAHAGQVSFPGGGVEAQDENAAATALREAEEEIGLPRHDVNVLGELDDYVTRSGFLVRPVVGFVADRPVWKPDAFEVETVFDVPLSHLMQPGHLECRQVMFEGGARRFYACTWQEHHIWGATAGMLKHFIDTVTAPA